MINKKGIWFLTLFSLILVLSVYYITMPSELLISNIKDKEKTTTKATAKEQEEPTNVVIEESDILVALRVEADEQMQKEMQDLQVILTNVESTAEEKNEAFDKMKDLNVIRGEEENLEKKIESEFKLKSFVKINGDQIRIVVSSEKHDAKLANNIMRSVQKNYDKKMYISVQFQK